MPKDKHLLLTIKPFVKPWRPFGGVRAVDGRTQTKLYELEIVVPAGGGSYRQ